MRSYQDRIDNDRDYSGSEADEYAGLLSTLEFHSIVSGWLDEFKTLYEKAESQGKKLDFNYPDKHAFYSDISPDWIQII